MNLNTIVEVEELTLNYRRTKHRVNSLKQTAIDRIKKRIEFEDFSALNHVSFKLERGETLALIGRNGSGKSTLLKVIARVLAPSAGRVLVRGSVAPMIELGAGFNPELTGAENILLYGTLLGRRSNDMKSRIESIADWAELTEHLEVPLRSYSSGMAARLAFATATDFVPELLLVDEVLSVGDEKFRNKSMARTLELMSQGSSMILVTHDLQVAQKMARKCLYLENGKAKAFGDTADVINHYLSDLNNV